MENKKIKEKSTPQEIYEILSGNQGNIELTEEGTKKFFEMLKKPNPARDRMIEKSKGISTPEQRRKFGKERVYVNFKLKDSDQDAKKTTEKNNTPKKCKKKGRGL